MNKVIKFLNIEWRTQYSLTNTILDCMAQLFFTSQYVWFLIHLLIALIPNSDDQLAKLIVHIIPLG